MARSRYRVSDARLVAQGMETSIDLSLLPAGHPHDLYADLGVDARELGARLGAVSRVLLDACVAVALAEAWLGAEHVEGRVLAARAKRWERWLRDVVRGAERDGLPLTFRFRRWLRPTVPGMIDRLDDLTLDLGLQRDALADLAPAHLLDRGAELLGRLRTTEQRIRERTVARDRALAVRDEARARFEAVLAAHDDAVRRIETLYGRKPPAGGRQHVPVPPRGRGPHRARGRGAAPSTAA